MKTMLLLVAGLLLTGTPAAHLRESVEVNLVEVPFSVTDSHGNFVADLKAEDLVVKEDGLIQKITHFTNFSRETVEVPLSISFLIDVSSSMGEKFGKPAKDSIAKMEIARRAAFLLLEGLRPQDKISILAFHQSPTRLVDFTSDETVAGEALAQLTPLSAGTSLYDSIAKANKELRRQSGRRILVVCTDGEDWHSKKRQDEVIKELNASDVTVVALGTMLFHEVTYMPSWAATEFKKVIEADYLEQRANRERKAKRRLEQIVNETAGYAFFPDKIEELPEVLKKLHDAVRTQYILGYHPAKESSSGVWRKIEIQCRRKGLKIRYRRGYVL